MALARFVPAPRTWVAAAFAGALMLLLATFGARAQEVPTLPTTIEDAVIADTAEQAGVDESEVEIVGAEAVTWNDGCLGIEPDDGACTQALVDGWVVWSLADGSAYRYHTDTTSDVRLAESGLDPEGVADAPLPDGATPRTDGSDGSIINGDIPSEGVALFEVTAAASVDDIRAALADQGCNAEVLAKTVNGRWFLYSFEAPDFVNDGFFASDGSSESAVAAGTLLMTNCLEGGTTPTPTPSPTVTPTPTPDGFSTDDVDESDREGAGALADVTVEAGDGADVITFEFADELEGSEIELVEGVPAYTVGYEADPAACGSGEPVELDGEAMLVVNFPATYSYDPDAGSALVTEPDLSGDLGTIVAVEQSCAFEGNSTWVFGVSSEAGFRVSEESTPDSLVIEVQPEAETTAAE